MTAWDDRREDIARTIRLYLLALHMATTSEDKDRALRMLQVRLATRCETETELVAALQRAQDQAWADGLL